MNYQTIRLTRDSAHVARLTLARPEIQNALSLEVTRELRHALAAVAADAQVRALVLTGEGKSFCAGGDLKWMQTVLSQGRDQRIADSLPLADLFYEFDHLPKVVIGRINGPATGGGFGLTCICDVVVASSTARFSLTEAKLGLVPANIGPYVARRLGLARARRYGLTARFIDAEQAERIGLVDRVATPDELDSAVAEEIDLVLSLPVSSIAATKKLFNDVTGRPPRECRTYTAEALADAWETPEAAEGIAAFLGKRPAAWKVAAA
ncbi:enoyl-CoA hydratase-related protein [Ramlibacter albus]|uniref:Enoyl-CoA hydratase/isomerase family protein n=1 Tax=Ramlibacter albus TaxID=2079448 RepID=A0A923M572_9BURK|nr:enoyl-CoA hydratase-related protein [Ramlibacter albus]MBC5762869.1 enoyl-CoA hydratase/isomerase family protein [Ramlibacter albus]